MSSFIGIIITIVYILFVSWLRPDFLDISAIQKLAPNEFGDLFAGIFGPLMLFWVVLGYLQQGKELKRSSEALELQAQELNATLQQHKEMVHTNNELFNLEKNRFERDIRPIFSLVFSSQPKFDVSGLVSEIQIKNEGGSAKNVTLVTDPAYMPKHPRDGQSYNFTHLDRNRTINLLLDFDPGFESPFGYKVNLTYSYWNNDKEEYGSQTLVVPELAIDIRHVTPPSSERSPLYKIK